MVCTRLQSSCDVYSYDGTSPCVYGTAGFRGKADLMPHVAHRCGMMVVLRSFSSGYKTLGICVTASHNPECDNGFKVADCNGGMPPARFEVNATKLVNAEDPLTVLKELTQSSGYDLDDAIRRDLFAKVVILVACDTRPSSPSLTQAVIAGVEAMGAKVQNLGQLTTPQLHWLVYKTNLENSPDLVNVDLYDAEFSRYFLEIFTLAGIPIADDILVVDASNGVGGVRAAGEIPKAALAKVGIQMCLRNVEGKVNDDVGSEYVEKRRRWPRNFFDENGSLDKPWTRCCSFDGDADRLVYFSRSDDVAALTDADVTDSYNVSPQFVLFDGDKIAVLYCKTIMKMLSALNTEFAGRHQSSEKPGLADSDQLTIGVLQTCFANGASTATLEEIQKSDSLADVSLRITCCKIGVKFLHAKAAECDIGIYFESNGHGNIVTDFDRLKSWVDKKYSTESRGYKVLVNYLHLFNPTVGDAITDLLAVEASLAYLHMSLKDWHDMYEDYPNKELQIPMRRELLNCMQTHPEHEKVLLSPVELQETIDISVSKYRKCRALCRPSGTENLARIYVEASNKEDVQMLATDLIDTVTRWKDATESSI